MKRALLPFVFVIAVGTATAQTGPSGPVGAPGAGDAGTAFAMGEAFRLGSGVAVDRDKAIGWYRKAAAQGHVGAQDALGIMLFTKGERRQAIPLLQAAAQRGDPRALYILGTAHFNGDAVPRDYPRAYAEMKRAAATGMPEAQRNLAKMEPFITADDRAQAVAILAGRETPPPALPVAPPPLAPLSVAPPPVASRPTPPPVVPSPVIPPPAAIGSAASSIVATPAPPSSPAPAEPPSSGAPSAFARVDPPAPLRSAPPATAASGRWRIQLGAYGTAARAEGQWAALAGRVPDLEPLRHTVSAAGAVWRLQAAGIADRVVADALCRRVATAGGACFIVAP